MTAIGSWRELPSLNDTTALVAWVRTNPIPTWGEALTAKASLSSLVGIFWELRDRWRAVPVEPKTRSEANRAEIERIRRDGVLKRKPGAPSSLRAALAASDDTFAKTTLADLERNDAYARKLPDNGRKRPKTTRLPYKD